MDSLSLPLWAMGKGLEKCDGCESVGRWGVGRVYIPLHVGVQRLPI
jgi:hypothetical protein